MTGRSSSTDSEPLTAPTPTIEDVLQRASLELDQMGLRIEQLRGVLAIYADTLPPDLCERSGEEIHNLDHIAGRLHALAAVVGLLRPDLGPRGGVDEALASFAA